MTEDTGVYATGTPAGPDQTACMEDGTHTGHRARLRQRFIEEGGFDHFSDIQVLELLLFYGNARADTNPLAHALLDTFGSLKGVLEARTEQLMSVKGIGETQAVLISMVVPLTRVWSKSTMETPQYIRNHNDLERYCRSFLLGRRTEMFYVICINAQGRVVGTRRISDGSLSEVSAYPRIVMETALSYNAHSVFFCHNHPGGTCAPSAEDIASTVQLQKLLNGVGIQVLDHMIIADDRAYSMTRQGDIDFRGGK